MADKETKGKDMAERKGFPGVVESLLQGMESVLSAKTHKTKSRTMRRAQQEDLRPIIELQKKIFHFEQNIPADDIEGFLDRNPVCWCAVCDGEIVSAAAAWEERCPPAQC